MLSTDTLITPNEVRLSGLIGGQTDTAQMQNLIIVAEERLFNQYFGSGFYAALMADKIAYAATLFAMATIYASGDYVLYNGQVYEVIQTTTGSQIPAQNPDYFTIPPKFATPANEFVWVRYLKRILAQAVANEYTVPSAFKQTEKGIIRLKDESFQPATAGEIATLKENNYQLIKGSIGVMEAYIMANSASYPTYKRVEEQAQNACGGDVPTMDKYRRNTFGFLLPKDRQITDKNNCPWD